MPIRLYRDGLTPALAQPARNRSSLAGVLCRSRLELPVGCGRRVEQPLGVHPDAAVPGSLAGAILLQEQNIGVNEWGNLSPWAYPNPAVTPWPMHQLPGRRRAFGGCCSPLSDPSRSASCISRVTETQSRL